jgi:WD40 repeat protein
MYLPSTITRSMQSHLMGRRSSLAVRIRRSECGLLALGECVLPLIIDTLRRLSRLLSPLVSHAEEHSLIYTVILPILYSADSSECLALLQGHTSLVGQLQLSNDRLVTGGSDGRVIVFNLANIECIHRLCAHDNSVTCLQFNDRFIVSGGNDGRVKLWDIQTGSFIRELTAPCEVVWRVSFKDDRVAILCKRAGSTVLEIVSFRPEDEDR